MARAIALLAPLFRALVLGIAALCLVSCDGKPRARGTGTASISDSLSPSVNTSSRKRALVVMSFHSPWKWTDDQLSGFTEAFGSDSPLLRVVQLDAKRKSDPVSVKARAKDALAAFDEFNPDIVFVQDDPAMQYFAPLVRDRGVPLVYSGINGSGEWKDLGTMKTTGSLERAHYRESLSLLRQFCPGVKKIAVVVDDDAASWDGVVELIKRQDLPENGARVVRYDTVRTFAGLKKLVLEVYPREVDAVCYVGVFGFRDEAGINVPYQDAMRWIAENSDMPDFSFWEDRVLHGTLCSVSVAGFEQGLLAGSRAVKILGGADPVSLPPEPSSRGRACISLRRARAIGVKVPADILLVSEVSTDYRWEHE